MKRRFSARVFACAPQTARDPSTLVGMTDKQDRLLQLFMILDTSSR